MWCIEIVYKFNNIVNRLMFDTREDGEAQRLIALPFLGKDQYDLKKNGGGAIVTFTDKFGTMDVDMTDVKTIRLYDHGSWDICNTREMIDRKRKLKDEGYAPNEFERQ